MATRKELLSSLGTLGQGLSVMQDRMQAAKSFEQEQKDKEAERQYLEKYRPKTLQVQDQAIERGTLGIADDKIKLEGSQKLKAARDALDSQVAGEWSFVAPEDAGNVMGWKAELATLNRSGDKAIAPQDYYRLKKESMAEEKRKQGKYESDLETDKSQRALLGTQAIKYQADATRPKPSDLPIDVKSEVTALSHKNAGKVSIANQLGSYLDQFKNAKTDDDKARIGGQMLKVLNSPEGADAIGVEEAKRLGDALEYNVFDVKAGLGIKPGNLVGRDLKGFERQVQSTYDAIKGSIDQNRSEVGRLMGRDSSLAGTDSTGSQDPRVQAALKAGYSMDEIRQFLGGRRGSP